MPWKPKFNKKIEGKPELIKKWNKVYKSCRSDDGSKAKCIRMANGVIKKDLEKK